MPGCALGLPSPAEQRAAGIQGAYPAQWQSSSGRCQPEVGQDGAQGREVGTKRLATSVRSMQQHSALLGLVLYRAL